MEAQESYKQNHFIVQSDFIHNTVGGVSLYSGTSVVNLSVLIT